MGRLQYRVVLFIGILICSAGATTGMTESPVTASPGSTTGFAAIADRCPSFSWGGVEGARAYELIVYKVGEGSVDVFPTEAGIEGLEDLRVALEHQLSGKISSWTPPIALCLSLGERYAWSIRALGDEGESAWSESRLFYLSALPSVTEVQMALRLLQRYVEAGGGLEVLEPVTTALDSEEVGQAGRRAESARAPATLPGTAAIRGEQTDPTGETIGVYGVSQSNTDGSLGVVGEAAAATGEVYGIGGITASPQGAGVIASNTGDGPDLQLVGEGAAGSAFLTEAGIDRPSPLDVTFHIENSDAGSMTLRLDGFEVVTVATDQDTLAALSCASGKLAKWNGAAWACDVDIDTNTLYFPGFGLDLAGSSSAFFVDTAEVQQRVTGVCPAGESIRVVDQDGTVACEVDDDTTYAFGSGLVLTDGVLSIDPPAFSTRISTLDSAGDVGWFTSIALGADGLGLISYFDNSNQDLKVAHCEDTLCTSATLSTIDSPGNVGWYTSIAIGADGLGLISYYDDATTGLNVAHCDDTLCTSATISTIDSAGMVGWHTSIAIGADGFGLISYYNATTDDLKVAHCDDRLCTSATISTIDSAGDVGWDTSIAIGIDGFGIIGYKDVTNYELKVAHCDNALCTSATTTTLANVTNADSISIAIGSVGLGIISYTDTNPTESSLRLAYCLNITCTNFSKRFLVRESPPLEFEHTSIAIGPDGFELIIYVENDTIGDKWDLGVAHCSGVFCYSHTKAALETARQSGMYNSIAIGADGLGLVSYYDSPNGNLKVAHLGINVP